MSASLISTHDAIRHALVSLLFRFEHVSADVPAGFASFDAGAGVREPQEIVGHLTGLIRFAHENLGGPGYQRPEALDWAGERRRFIEAVKVLDADLAAGAEASGDISLAQMWRGPIIDAITHIGQLATLRRLAGAPVGPIGPWRPLVGPTQLPLASITGTPSTVMLAGLISLPCTSSALRAVSARSA